MKERVHILATVRKPELLPAALLVFRTLRVGFPKAEVWVWGNRLRGDAERAVAAAAVVTGAVFNNLQGTVHDAWIEELIQEEPAPFWICDTDVIFWQSMEWEPWPEAAFSGRLEPEFLDEFTKTRHMERLHTAVMWINPGPLRAAMRAWMSRIPAPWGHLADFTLVKQTFVPSRDGVTLCYDTMAGLWHAGIGLPFLNYQDAAFDHLHCATYIDLIGPKLSTNLRETHEAIYRDHTLARGMLEHQRKYYERRKEPHAI